MKPLKLIMQAFGSYGEKTVIDFTRLNQNLFLVTGDTGSGKSTVFDAIVFALYGETGSMKNKKSGLELQSQFVDYDKKPFVEFTFSETGALGSSSDSFQIMKNLVSPPIMISPSSILLPNLS